LLTAEFKRKAETMISHNNNLNELSDNSENSNRFLRIKKIIEYLEEYLVIHFHKNVAKTQRLAYTNHFNPSFLKNKLLIEVDYKEKFKIGFGPRQTSGEWYKQIQRSCLGFY
jgi:hypothetical protein